MGMKGRPGRYVALLRGINVSGKNRLPMADLVDIFESIGCTDVRTYIQSGNVAFTATAATAGDVARRVTEAIETRFDMRVPVITRSAAELARVLENNPFLDEDVDENALHIMFLADAPDAERAARLDPDRSPPDRFELLGSELYLCLPNGVGKSKLTNAYVDRTLDTISTGRNLRTSQRLLELAEST